MTLILIAFAVGLVLGLCASALYGWARGCPRRAASWGRPVPLIPAEPTDWSNMRSGAMPAEWFDWNPEYRPPSFYADVTARVLEGGE